MKLLIGILFSFVLLDVSAQNNSLLWKISGNGLKESSYLYGTMHLMDKRLFRFGDSVMVKFNECEAMAAEVVMDDVNPKQRVNAIMMPKDTTLDMLLSPGDYKMVKAKAKENLGFLSGVIDHVKPFYTSVLITTLKTETDSTEALDAYFQKIAKRKGMKLIGIESIDEQLAAVDKISLKEQATMLVSSLNQEEKNDQELNELFDIYLTQDLDKLDSFVQKSEMPDMMSESLLRERNHLMADRLATIISTQPTFIAIGAAHLPGQEGVIALLKQKGFNVTPVFSKYTGNAQIEDLEDSESEQGKQVFYSNNSELKYEVWFPVQFQHDKEEKVIVAVNSETGVIYTLSEESINEVSAEQYFKNHFEKLKGSKMKILKEKRVKINRVPTMSVELEKEGIRIHINYYYLGKNTGVELSATGNAGKIHNKMTKRFFYSLDTK